MPIYGYRCQSCSREFEVLQRMTDPAGAACPDCGGAGTRPFYPAGILFKGSGFYKTDSRSNGASAPAASGSSKDAGGGAQDKPAATPAASPAADKPASTSSSPPSPPPATPKAAGSEKPG